MKLEPPYITLADPSLPHQVVFFVIGGRVNISCNCLRIKHVVYNSHRQNSMGETESSLDHARELYNDPANHRIPFSKEDEAKW